MAQKMYVDANDIIKDWGCSRAKAYQIIADLYAKLLKMNPHSIIIQGKCNRKRYLEKRYDKSYLLLASNISKKVVKFENTD